jgi:Lon protease-like protein
MCPGPSGAESPLVRVPLFPLKTVLFPRGRLALKIFEQRYLAMAKSSIAAGTPFGVCSITRGEEVALPDARAPEFASVGTFARIRSWDMPQLGILQVMAVGEERFAVRRHELMPDALVVADVAPIPPEPAVALSAQRHPLAKLLEHLAARIGPQHFPDDPAFDDASWVGGRLTEIMPLPLPMKQALLEMSDADARLARLQRFIDDRIAS